MFNRKLYVILVVLLLALAAGCATANFKRDAYRTLGAAGATYDAAMKSLADLYDKGVIGNAEKTKAIEYGGYFWAAYHTAADAMVVYMETENAADEARVTKAMAMLSQALSRFMDVVQPMLAKGGDK